MKMLKSFAIRFRPCCYCKLVLQRRHITLSSSSSSSSSSCLSTTKIPVEEEYYYYYYNASILQLNKCRNSKQISQTHAFIITTGLLLFTNNKLIIILYNTMIKALSHSSTPSQAILLFQQIQRLGLRPDSYSFPFVLRAVIRMMLLLPSSSSRISEQRQLGRGIHCQAFKLGLELDVHVATALIQLYSSFRCVSDARKLFDSVRFLRDVALWNSIIDGYAKVGDLDNAHHLFELMPARNVISWTCVIVACVRRDRPEEGLALFRRMQLQGVEPDEVAMLAALSACADLGVLNLGEWIHNYIDKHQLRKTVPLNNALIDMYAKSGNIEKAVQVFEDMKSRTVVTWTTIISGLALHGLAKDALEMFSRMEKARVKPNEITLISVLSACSHVGLVDLGWWCFNNMGRMYGIKPKIEHYGCMIDLLARAGYLREAQELVRRMPFEANAAIWGSLLAAANVHKDPNLGRHALQHLVKLEPHHSGNYALLSNIYANLGRWNDSRMVRKVMRDANVRKMPGGSFIEVNNRVNEFVAGDSSHPLFDTVYEVLCQIDGHLKTIKHLGQECVGLLEEG